MIYDQSSETVVSNLGWVDRGSLWTFSVETGAETRIVVDGARYLGLKAGSEGMFRVAHHHAPDQAVSIRHCAAPAVERVDLTFDRAQPRFSGDALASDSFRRAVRYPRVTSLSHKGIVMTVDLLNPEILRDIADKLWAAQKDMEEIKSRMKSTPASERTPEWQSENEKQMKACYERLDALGQRFSELNAALDSPEPGSRH